MRKLSSYIGRYWYGYVFEMCIRDRNGISAKEAEKKIAKIDKYRADYYKYYTRCV